MWSHVALINQIVITSIKNVKFGCRFLIEFKYYFFNFYNRGDEFWKGEGTASYTPDFLLTNINFSVKFTFHAKIQENMNKSMFFQTIMLTWNMINNVIHLLQTGSLKNVSWLNDTFSVYFVLCEVCIRLCIRELEISTPVKELKNNTWIYITNRLKIWRYNY